MLKKRTFFHRPLKERYQRDILAASDVPFRGIVATSGVSDFFKKYASPGDEIRKTIPKQFGLNLEESFTKMSAVKWPEKFPKIAFPRLNSLLK